MQHESPIFVWIRPSRLGRVYILVDSIGQAVATIEPATVRELVFWDAQGPADDEPSDESRKWHEELGLDSGVIWEGLAVAWLSELEV
jgi:hypothetical protein